MLNKVPFQIVKTTKEPVKQCCRSGRKRTDPVNLVITADLDKQFQWSDKC